MSENSVNTFGTPEYFIRDIKDCLAIVSMSVMALEKAEDSLQLSVVQKLHKTLSLALVSGEQGIFEIERIHQ